MARPCWFLILLFILMGVVFAHSDCKANEGWSESDLKRMAAHSEADEQKQLELGFAYQCRNNNTEAARWYMLAATRGNAVAQTNLGAMYLLGQGVAQDDGAAARYFQLAAVAGFGPAQNNLALLYSTGRGVRQSDEAAFQWLARAVANHYYPAYPSHAAQYLTGRGVARDEVRGFELMLQAAKHGLVGAQAEVGMLYAMGRGTKADPKKSLVWSLKAAKGGSAGAANNVGYFYAQQGNYTEAISWYRRAAAAGIVEAEHNLAAIERAGLGVSRAAENQRLKGEAVKAYLPASPDTHE